jgi:hypothetical protein
VKVAAQPLFGVIGQLVAATGLARLCPADLKYDGCRGRLSKVRIKRDDAMYFRARQLQGFGQHRDGAGRYTAQRMLYGVQNGHEVSFLAGIHRQRLSRHL